jgi:hypothetical protein
MRCSLIMVSTAAASSCSSMTPAGIIAKGSGLPTKHINHPRDHATWSACSPRVQCTAEAQCCEQGTCPVMCKACVEAGLANQPQPQMHVIFVSRPGFATRCCLLTIPIHVQLANLVTQMLQACKCDPLQCARQSVRPGL